MPSAVHQPAAMPVTGRLVWSAAATAPVVVVVASAVVVGATVEEGATEVVDADVVVVVAGSATTSGRLAVASHPIESVEVIASGKVPDAVGVPARVPSAPSVTPSGSAPVSA